MYFKDEYENIFEDDLPSIVNERIDTQQESTPPATVDDAQSDDDSEFEGFEDCNLILYENPMTIAEVEQNGDESWIKPIEDEYVAQLLNNTWEIVERPKNRKVIGNRFVFRTKENNQKKVRLVAKGCSQRPGEDFSDTYSPVVRSTSVRLLAALSAELNLEIHQMDVVTAYLNGELDEEVFMEIPERLINILEKLNAGKIIGTCAEKSNQVRNTAKKWLEAYRNCKYPVCKIQKALYGLRQSGLKWYQKLTSKLRELKLRPSEEDPCLFVLKDDEKIIIVTVYVDDLLIASNNKFWLNKVKNSLAESFEMKDLGHVKQCLGIEFNQNMSKRTIHLNQRKYAESVLNRFNMSECKPVRAPMEPNCKLEKPREANEDLMKKYPYQNLIGALMYLAVNTRPDIAYAVNFLSQFNTNFDEKHWQAAKRILRYLKGTLNYGLLYRQNNTQLYGVVDADWAANMSDRRSYSGYAFILAGAAVSWEARKQRTVSLSSTESEYLAISEATKEAMYLKQLLNEIGLKCETIQLYNDSQSAQKLATSFGFHPRTKHIDVRHHFIKQKQQHGEICLEYVPTEEMPADVLTKGLTAEKHLKCIAALGMTNADGL